MTIQTTHVGSLPRPPGVADLLFGQCFHGVLPAWGCVKLSGGGVRAVALTIGRISSTPRRRIAPAGRLFPLPAPPPAVILYITPVSPPPE